MFCVLLCTNAAFITVLHITGDFVYCSCGECGECLQDVQTAAAIIGDRQRAITELEGSQGCAELHLPTRWATDAHKRHAQGRCQTVPQYIVHAPLVRVLFHA